MDFVGWCRESTYILFCAIFGLLTVVQIERTLTKHNKILYYRTNNLVVTCSHTQQYNWLYILILMTTCVGPADHHLAILQKLKLGTCNAVMSMGSHNTYSCIKYE